ncbi:MAG: cell division protein FtsQ/DivIB [Terriglobales bacterium]
MPREIIEVNPKDAPRSLAASPGDSPGRIAISSRTTSERASSDRGRVRQRYAQDPSIHAGIPDLEDAIDFDGDLDGGLDGEDGQFLRTQRRVPVRRTTLTRKTLSKLKVVAVLGIVAGAFISMAVGAYLYGMSSWRFRIESTDNVAISGVNNASRTQVMDVAGADIGKNIFYVPLDERKHQLEQIPWVESATVMRVLPNRISVNIRERVPVAFAQIGSRIGLIDAHGVVMGMPANRQTKYSFPVIHGIADTEPLSSRAAAMKIYNRMAQELDSGGPDGKGYMQQLSEVDLSDPEDVKVTTAPPGAAKSGDAGGTLLIHLGAADFLSRYQLYVDHVAEWRKQFPNLQSVDLRYEGQIVVNPDAERRAQSPAPRLIEGPAPVKIAAKAATPSPSVQKKPAHRGNAEAKKGPTHRAGAESQKQPIHRGSAEARRKAKKRSKKSPA